MTITKEQLDELGRRAQAELSSFIPLRVSIAPDVTLQLVAIARAALAWSEARLARQAMQTRAGIAETSDKYNAAMRELPAAKEADVLATLALLSVLGGAS